MTEVAFRTESDPGSPLPAVEISIDGETHGKSDRAGVLVTEIQTKPSDPVRVTYACPAGHSRPKEVVPLRLRPSVALGSRLSSRPEVTLRCKPRYRVVVFVVRTTPRTQVPVLADGSVVATTNEDGVALLTMRAATGARVEIQLDTTSYPRFVPSFPSRRFTVGTEHDIFVFDQRFESQSPPQRPVRPRIIKIE